MLQALWEQLVTTPGAGDEIGAGAMALRAVIIYAFTLAIVRLGSRRFLARPSAFDVIVAIMLGSVMSRAIDGSAPFLPTLLAGGVLLGMHWLFAIVAVHTDWLGPIVKGEPVLLIEDGTVQQPGLRRAHLTSEDLAEALRLSAGHADPSRIRRAYMERNGQVSVVPCPQSPRTLDVHVAEGVQTVRIELQ